METFKMRLRPLNKLLCSLLIFFLIFNNVKISKAGWSAKAAAVWTSCWVKATCPSSPICEASDVNILGNVSETCGPIINGNCKAYAKAEGGIAWRVHGEGLGVGGGTFKTAPYASIEARGERVSPSLFVVTGTSSRLDSAMLELAVFRFSGDPNDFDGVNIRNISDLLIGGYISNSDILLYKLDDEISPAFAYDIDVTGIPDSQIVVFSSGHGESDVTGGGSVGMPVFTDWGFIALILLLITMGTIWIIRK